MKASPLQTEDEVQLVRLFLIIGVMLDMVHIESRKLNSPKYLRMSKIYVLKMRMIQSDAEQLMLKTGSELKSKGIKILEEVRRKTHIEAKYLCRGYSHTMILQGDLVKAEIEQQMAVQFGVDITKASEGV